MDWLIMKKKLATVEKHGLHDLPIIFQGVWGAIAQEDSDPLVQEFRHRCEMAIAADGESISGLLSSHCTCPIVRFWQPRLVSTTFTAKEGALISRKALDMRG
jgi:hypothetical protein